MNCDECNAPLPNKRHVLGGMSEILCYACDFNKTQAEI